MAQPPLKKPKRVHPWRNEYAREFGVRVLDRDVSSGDVFAVECRFCAVFGREERALEGDEKDGVPVSNAKTRTTPALANENADGETASGRSPHDTTADADMNASSSSSSSSALREKKSRARTRSIATWKKSFRSDNMRSHHLEQHPRKWREYQQLLIHVKKEQALHGFLLHPPVKGSGDGDGGGEGERIEELAYSQQLSAFFGDPTSSASECQADPVGGATSKSQLSTPSRRERKGPHTKSNTNSSSSTPVQPAQQQSQDTSVLQVADSSVDILVLNEITIPAIVDELVSSLFDTQREDEDHKAQKQVNGSSAGHQNGSAASPRSTPASSSLVVELRPIYTGESATTAAEVSNGPESISNNIGEGTAVPADQQVSKYGIALKSVSEYSYVRQLLRLEETVAFDQIAKIVAISRAQFKLESRLPSTSQDDIREYAKFVVTTDLQMISDMMRGSWAYSLALQSSTGRPISDIDDDDDDNNGVEGCSAIEVRVRFPSSKGTDVEDFHLITVPYPSPAKLEADRGFSRSDAAALIIKTLLVLDPQWQKKLIGVCDEATIRSMDVVSSVVDVIEEAATGPFYRVLRGAGLVEASLLKALDGLLAESEKETSGRASSVGFLEILYNVVQYLHTQQQWSKTHGVCPSLRTNKRLSTPWLLLETLEWFVTRRELIGQLQSELEPPGEAKLSAEWWVVCLALSDILSDFRSIYHTLGKKNDDANKTQQEHPQPSCRAILTQFLHAQTLKLDVSQVEQAHQVDNLEADEASLQLKRFRWTKDSIVAFFRSLNLSTRRLYSQLSPEEQATVVHQVGRFVLQSLNFISSCARTRGSSAGDTCGMATAAAEEAIPPTRPLDFVAIERGAVVDFIEHHSARLELSYDLAFIDGVSKQIKDLRDLVASNAKIKASLVEAHGKSFREAWEPVEGFSSTRALAAGFATAVPRSHEAGTHPVSSSRNRLVASRSSLQTEVQAHALQIEDVENAHKLFQIGTSSPLL